MGPRPLTKGISLWWPVLSRNKKCVTLNLRTERGQELLLELVRRSDVVVENFRPARSSAGTWASSGCASSTTGSSWLASRAMAQTGPYAQRAGFASVSEAMGGLRYINGFPNEPPPRIGISLGDSLAGMFAAQGVMAALYKRDALGLRPRPDRGREHPRGLLCPAGGNGADTTASASCATPAGPRSRAWPRRTSSSRATASGWFIAANQDRCLPAVRDDGPARARRRPAL